MLKLNKEILKYFNLLGVIGLTMALNILLAVAFYKVVEKYLFKSTIVFIGFLIFGAINGLYNVYKMIFKKK